MRFNSLSHKLKYEKQYAKIEAQVKLVRQWRRAFAWFPERISDNQILWLEWIEISYPNANIGTVGGLHINYQQGYFREIPK